MGTWVTDIFSFLISQRDTEIFLFSFLKFLIIIIKMKKRERINKGESEALESEALSRSKKN